MSRVEKLFSYPSGIATSPAPWQPLANKNATKEISTDKTNNALRTSLCTTKEIFESIAQWRFHTFDNLRRNSPHPSEFLLSKKAKRLAMLQHDVVLAFFWSSLGTTLFAVALLVLPASVFSAKPLQRHGFTGFPHGLCSLAAMCVTASHPFWAHIGRKSPNKTLQRSIELDRTQPTQFQQKTAKNETQKKTRKKSNQNGRSNHDAYKR